MLENSSGKYSIDDLDKIWFEYDRQNDILYINFGYDVEEADEEILSGEDTVLRIKNKKIVSIMIMNFMAKIGVTIC
uniref:DUF2283 domain-containing protein n=1 Tax=Staphylothermus marinus TaxID=2280 RepID=A0A7C4H8Y0_STAMA